MGKKGAKRKTRWRTLSIGTPPGEEDEEDDKGGTRGHHPRNGYAAWHKSRHGSAGSSSGSGNGNGNGGSTTSGYASSRSRGDASFSSESPSRVMFNEEEYTRITTPRQDMLFKKGYLSQRKPWTSTTPSTNESQSASHSTADCSEAAEDQQLLDGCTAAAAPAEYVTAVPVMDPSVGYPTYYDQATGVYYAEYPAMMLVTPAPMPADQTPMLATMPCAPVPLRPIEWVNPAYVPKLASQQYCYMDYQTTHTSDCAALVDAQGVPLTMLDTVPAPLMNGLSDKTDESSIAVVTGGSVSSNSPVVVEEYLHVSEHHEPEFHPTNELQPRSPPELQSQQEVVQEQLEIEPEQGLMQEPAIVRQEPDQEPLPQLQAQEVLATVTDLEPVVEYSEVPYVETLPPQPMHHVAHHVIPQNCQQSYVYPGQYMFGPPVVNVNGMTVQNGPMLRCSDMVTNTGAAVVAKRRRKKKKRKQKRPITLGNMEDDDEEDYYSSEENSLSSSRVSWSSPPSSSSVPLNPECQEFYLPPTIVKSKTTLSEASVSSPEFYPNSYTTSAYMSLPLETHVGSDPVKKSELRYDESTVEFVPKASKAIAINSNHVDNEAKRLTDEEPLTTRETTTVLDNHLDMNGKTEDQTNVPAKTLTNGDLTYHIKSVDLNGCLSNGDQEDNEKENEKISDNKVSRPPNGEAPCIKYNGKVQKIISESMPDAADLNKKLNPTESLTKTCSKDDSRSIENLTSMLSATSIIEAEVSQKGADSDNWLNESSIVSESPKVHHDEDSGFESQSIGGKPITKAVSDWLKRANSPDLFITMSSGDEDDEDEDDASVSNEPSKNLQGNPMPALSVNGEEARRGKFASSTEGRPKTKPKRNRKRKAGRKHDRATSKTRRDFKTPVEQQHTSISLEKSSLGDKKEEDRTGEVCELTEKDSDAGMRVAENTRMNKRRGVNNNNEDDEKQQTDDEGEYQLTDVKTYEKGEIVVSMDGELLLVQEKRRASSTSTATLGSIEEPDVLDCWEAETIEPMITSPKKEDAKVPVEKHAVQKYYRLQQEEPKKSDDEDSVEEEPVISSTVPGQDSDEYSRMPVEEAFEVYESCYTAKAPPVIETRYFRDTRDEGPVPCKAVCCSVQ